MPKRDNSYFLHNFHTVLDNLIIFGRDDEEDQ